MRYRALTGNRRSASHRPHQNPKLGQVDDVATDGALVDAEPGRQVADRAGAAALQDLEQGEHPDRGSRHRRSIALIPGGHCPLSALACWS